jgi:DNA-binding transcriptional regulator YdaS (Cro superfamily)
MNLKQYMQAEKGNATKLAAALGIPLSFLSQMASGNRTVSPERASAMELASEGQITREELRPDDWQLIWPELVKRRRKAISQPVASEV